MQPTLRVGVIGCGAISGAYLGIAKQFPQVEIVAVSDMNRAAAEAKAKEFGVPRVLSVDELLAAANFDCVLNLTIPAAHAPLTIRALEAKKHVYLEKPLAVDLVEGKQVLDAAAKSDRRVGCAPDTVLGSGIQTARKLIDDGAIGKPVAFTAFMLSRGHEHWHPSPAFYYAKGGGPMLDMGPYYVTALLNLLGPMKRIAGMTSTTQNVRTIMHMSNGQRGPLYGQAIDVQTPDHVAGTIEFTSGCVGTIITSFSTRAAEYNAKQPITIYGTAGTLRVPDPNGFDGPVSLCRFGEGEDTFIEQPPLTRTGLGRSIGLADMADAIVQNRPHRCSLEQAYAALEAMTAFYASSDSGRFIEIEASYERPMAMESVS